MCSLAYRCSIHVCIVLFYVLYKIIWYSMLLLFPAFMNVWTNTVFSVVFRWFSTTIMASKRTYNSEFLNLGFTHVTHQGVLKLQCVICGEVLSNESFKKHKLTRHLKKKTQWTSQQGPELFWKKGAATEKAETGCSYQPSSYQHATTNTCFLPGKLENCKS